MRALLTLLFVGDLTGQGLEDLRPLASARALVRLGLGRNRVGSLAPLAQAAQLAELDVRENGLVSLGAVSRLTRLRRLDAVDNAVRDLIPLADHPALQSVKLVGNPVADASPLDTLAGQLTLRLVTLDDVCHLERQYALSLGFSSGSVLRAHTWRKSAPKWLVPTDRSQGIELFAPCADVARSSALLLPGFLGE